MSVLEQVGLSESNLSDKAVNASFHTKVSLGCPLHSRERERERERARERERGPVFNSQMKGILGSIPNVCTAACT